ncbi:hypothetical protein [Planctomycetes bacterium TBK1r]|uniref:Type II secretion system protein D n=1 Tax=Stieleria magnilauensis TaxID=2527963 RepID=A0ABX5XX82_9BACT|nr:hypothetical protein TBK1r_56470 [Planctomycetes bacterium TBK1r]
MNRCSRYLCCSALLLALIVGSGNTSAQERSESTSTVAKLQTHAIPDGFPPDVLAQFASVVPVERMIYFAERRQLVVYGKPELQLEVMKRIVAVPREQRPPTTAAVEPPGQVKALSLPRRPVTIVHLKDLDLLLIRFGR